MHATAATFAKFWGSPQAGKPGRMASLERLKTSSCLALPCPCGKESGGGAARDQGSSRVQLKLSPLSPDSQVMVVAVKSPTVMK